MVVVYSKPACVQCTATKRRLDTLGVEYTTIDVTEDEKAFAELQERGFQQVPVVRAGDDWWSGFQPDKLDSLS